MYNFYKLMHLKASESVDTYGSIKELTLEIARKAGYYRKNVLLKNGNEVVRTKYLNKFDDILVAKWYCHFEKMFCGKLSHLSYLKDYHVQILERTFMIFFNALQLEKILSDTSVTTTVYACFNCRIGDVMQELATDSRFERYIATKGVKVRNSEDRVVLKSYINNNALSLDTKIDNVHTISDTLTCPSTESDLILDIKNRLSNDKIGLRFLDALVNSDKHLTFGNVENFIKLETYEHNSQTLSRLRNAYKIILNTIKEYYPNEDYKTAYSRKLSLRKNECLSKGSN